MALVEQMASQNDPLAWRLQTALSQLYRRKSETISPEQVSLFLSKLGQKAEQANVEAVDPQNAPEAEPSSSESPEAPPRKKAQPKQPHRKPLLEDLRREIRAVAVPAEECTCPNGSAERQPMGYERSESWEYKSGEFHLVEQRLEKRVCKKCQEGVVTAEGTPTCVSEH